MNATRSKLTAALGVALAVSVLAVGPADARRGGSFGSRGSRTFSAPRPTQTAPSQVAPVQRSMTQRPTQAPRPGAPVAAPAPAPARGGMFGGFGGGLLGGLLAGGLIGGLMGHGFGGGWGGGGGGFLTILLQLAIVGLGVWLLMKLFRRPQPAGQTSWPDQAQYTGGAPGPFGPRPVEPGPAPSAPYVPADDVQTMEIPTTQGDRDTFERLLREIQEAFGREDYGALRERTTPEIMSYLSEELSQNATHGRRNEVTGTRLLQADVGEAWREGDTDYATAAMRYESTDVMRDRQTGAVVEGDPSKPTETTELWTFARQAGGPWKLSAIQET